MKHQVGWAPKHAQMSRRRPVKRSTFYSVSRGGVRL